MNLFETHYSRWEGKHTSIWVRRFHIANHGFKATLRGKLMKWLVGVSWSLSFSVCTALFLLNQVVQEDSILERLGEISPAVKPAIDSVTNWLVSNPDISISALYNLFFFVFVWLLSFLSLVGVTKCIPHLLTQDLSSKSLIIYTSKAINKADYFLGKFGAIAGVLCSIWIIPCTVAWLAANAFAPKWNFFVYSSSAIYHALVYFVINIVATSFIAMAFSSISSNPRATTGAWLGYWIFSGFLAPISTINSQWIGWIKYLSIQHNLTQIQFNVFDLQSYYERTIEKLPTLENTVVLNFLSSDASKSTDAFIWTIILCIVSIIVIVRKIDLES